MEKEKIYKLTRFSSDVVREAYEKILELAIPKKETSNRHSFTVEYDGSKWTLDEIEEFFAEYRKYKEHARFMVECNTLKLTVDARASTVFIDVCGSTRVEIETIFEVFERHLPNSLLPKELEEEPQKPTIFIGHGRCSQWRVLKDHLQDKHDYKVVAYETGARAGHHIRDILEDMISQSSFALLVLSAEDEQPNGNYRCRQNVVHEAGLFQGRLGFSRAILLMEDGVEEFSNIQGMQQLPYQKNNIKEIFGDVLATLHREFS